MTSYSEHIQTAMRSSFFQWFRVTKRMAQKARLSDAKKKQLARCVCVSVDRRSESFKRNVNRVLLLYHYTRNCYYVMIRVLMIS